MSVNIMTAELLAQHGRVGTPATCAVCEQPIRVGQVYADSVVFLTCASCHVARTHARIDVVRQHLEAAQRLLNGIEAAITRD